MSSFNQNLTGVSAFVLNQPFFFVFFTIDIMLFKKGYYLLTLDLAFYKSVFHF